MDKVEVGVDKADMVDKTVYYNVKSIITFF